MGSIASKEACHIADFLYKVMHAPILLSRKAHIRPRSRILQSFNQRHASGAHRLQVQHHECLTPQPNGLDEHFNQTLKAQLQKMVNIHQDDWDDLLDNILCAYRTSHQVSTKCIPFLLMFGQEAQLSIMQFDMSEASCKRAAQRAFILRKG